VCWCRGKSKLMCGFQLKRYADTLCTARSLVYTFAWCLPEHDDDDGRVFSLSALSLRSHEMYEKSARRSPQRKLTQKAIINIPCSPRMCGRKSRKLTTLKRAAREFFEKGARAARFFNEFDGDFPDWPQICDRQTKNCVCGERRLRSLDSHFSCLRSACRVK
jgi:hypothetical protein